MVLFPEVTVKDRRATFRDAEVRRSLGRRDRAGFPVALRIVADMNNFSRFASASRRARRKSSGIRFVHAESLETKT